LINYDGQKGLTVKMTYEQDLKKVKELEPAMRGGAFPPKGNRIYKSADRRESELAWLRNSRGRCDHK
jgi:hypothetical protein